MSKSYPRVSTFGEKKTQKLCECCDHKAKYYAEIQYSYMRGDDDQVLLCHDHYQMAKVNIGKVISMAHYKANKRKIRVIQ